MTGVAPRTGESIPQFTDRINDEWVVAARRMSPRLLLSSLAWVGEQITELWKELPQDQVGEPVSWAGPDPAPVWLDAARDFTEHWVHRQQVHEALDQPTGNDPATLHTVIDTFIRALPHTLRDQHRPVGTTFSFVVSGTAGGSWTVERHIEGWRLTGHDTSPNAVVLDAEHTWRLSVRMTKPGMPRSGATATWGAPPSAWLRSSDPTEHEGLGRAFAPEAVVAGARPFGRIRT